eukprot:TRINITY_DN90998_c0_g1_i1.p1 TRINITY_DN90998_c0_g1~~TRINITY_DN90998_c0_g1_i1.p1  ORF type:complete len:146 (-),score=36.58 TRINITY_DN90998_c0_g1_i1:177-557(-)
MTDVEPRDIEVCREDQMRINTFSRLNLRYEDLDQDITEIKKKVQTYKDATEEIEGCMEDEGIMLKIGEAYTPIDEDTATEKLAKLIETSEAQLTEKTEEIEKTKEELDALKKVLYAKFGTSINLEK